MDLEEGAYCETTRRIVILSPFPAAIRQLVMALTIRCYDVMVFHHEHDPALTALHTDLILIDRTRAVGLPAFRLPTGSTSVPILLVGSQEEAEETEGEAIVWPCPIETALQRIDEAARRHRAIPALEPTGLLRYKDLSMDLKRITLQRGNKRVELTKTEFDLLKALMASGGAVLTREDIMDAVWGDQYYGGSNSVDVHIKSLRHKLGDDPKKPLYIATVRGVGYRLADE